MFSVDWKVFFIVGLLLVIVVGVWLMIAGSREKDRKVLWSEFRVHLGTALLISAITIILVDLQLKHEIESAIDKIPDTMLTYVSHDDPGLKRAVDKQIIWAPLRYSEFVIEQQLYPSGNSDRSVLSWDTEFKVQNISPSEYDWEFNPSVTSDFPNNPHIKIDLPVVKEMGRSESIKLSEAKYYEDQSPEATAHWEIKITLKPGVIYQVFVHRVADDQLKGYMTHFVTKITNGMKFTLLADPNLFEIQIESFYPGKLDKIFDPSSNGEKANSAPHTKSSQPVRAWQYTISETLLPQQGLQVYWKYKRPNTNDATQSSN